MRPLVFLFFFAFLATAQAQNMGVDEPNPQEKLHVRGSIRTDSALVLHPHTALTPANAITLPNHVSTISISLDNATVTTNDLTGPANPIEGQVLTILNEDDDPATFANVEIAPTEGVNVYQYINSSWRLLSKTPVAAGGGGGKTYMVNPTSDASIVGVNAVNMPGMTITFTPENPVVLVTVSASGAFTGASFNSRTNIWFDIQKDGVNQKRIAQSVSVVNTGVTIPYTWAAHGKVPVTVTPGQETTLNIRWASATSGAADPTLSNSPTSNPVHYRTLIIEDKPLEP